MTLKGKVVALTLFSSILSPPAQWKPISTLGGWRSARGKLLVFWYGLTGKMKRGLLQLPNPGQQAVAQQSVEHQDGSKTADSPLDADPVG